MMGLLGGGAREMRTSAQQADLNMPALAGLSEKKAQKKLEEIKGGGELQEQNPVLPDERHFQDCFWLVFFLATVTAVLVTGYAYSGNITSAVSHRTDHLKDGLEFPPISAIIGAGAAATLAALATAFAFIVLAHRAPACVVWTSLFFTPFVLVTVGLVLLGVSTSVSAEDAFPLQILGAVFLAFGLCAGACVMCCWRRLVPFMIAMTRMIADVIEQHPCMLVVGLIGGIMSLVWTVAVQVAFVGLYMEFHELVSPDSRLGRNAAAFVYTLLFTWGGLVCSNFCHVSYAGVFARWYYQGDQAESPLNPAISDAVKASGSICFGSFLVGIVRATEQVAELMRRNAMEDGNYVACVVLCVIECFISCIGDILEYFNEWAFVQVAIRGTSFITSAKITFSMISCANVQFIIADLLLNSLVTLGSLLCAATGAASGAVVGYLIDGDSAMLVGGVLGFFVGILAGCSCCNVTSSGVKTILCCWADNPEPLSSAHSNMNEAFVEKISDRLHGQT